MENEDWVVDKNSVEWISTSEFPINRLLLEGSKLLMKNLYDLERNSFEDFLPESYHPTPSTHELTKYQYHWNNPTHIYWTCITKFCNNNSEEEEGEEEDKVDEYERTLLWDCEKGIVQTIRFSFLKTIRPRGGIHKGKMVLNDCSGFIWGLFAYTNNRIQRNFPQMRETNFEFWKVGKKVPLVGVPILDKFCFVDVTFENIQPGDIIAWSLFFTKAKDGHIMLVCGVVEDNQNNEKLVSIVSVGTTHFKDTRIISSSNKISGLGMGYAKISNSSVEDIGNGFIGFKIRPSSQRFLRAKIVRALNTPQLRVLKTKENEAYLGMIGDNNNTGILVLSYRFYKLSERKYFVPVFDEWVELKGWVEDILVENNLFWMKDQSERKMLFSPELFDMDEKLFVQRVKTL